MNGLLIWCLRILHCFIKIILNGPNILALKKKKPFIFWLYIVLKIAFFFKKKLLAQFLPLTNFLEKTRASRDGLTCSRTLLKNNLRHIKKFKSLYLRRNWIELSSIQASRQKGALRSYTGEKQVGYCKVTFLQGVARLSGRWPNWCWSGHFWLTGLRFHSKASWNYN